MKRTTLNNNKACYATPVTAVLCPIRSKTNNKFVDSINTLTGMCERRIFNSTGYRQLKGIGNRRKRCKIIPSSTPLPLSKCEWIRFNAVTLREPDAIHRWVRYGVATSAREGGLVRGRSCFLPGKWNFHYCTTGVL